MGRPRQQRQMTREIMKTGQCAPPPARRVQGFYSKLTANRLERKFVAYIQTCSENGLQIEEICKKINNDFKCFLDFTFEVKDFNWMLDNIQGISNAYILGNMGNDVSHTLLREHMLNLALSSMETKDVLNYFKMERELATTKSLGVSGAKTPSGVTPMGDSMPRITLNLTVDEDDE